MKVFRGILVSLNVLLAAGGFYIVWGYVEDEGVKTLLYGVIVLFVLLGIGDFLYFRRRFVDFSNEVCRYTDEILHGNPMKQAYNQETLSSKMVMELEKVEDIFACQLSESKKEKQELQEMISEMTHQIKTPVSNIQMYCEMFSEPDISGEQAKHFVSVIQQQLGKLEFLLNTLVKSSRLETAMINLSMENSRVIDTLALAVNNVMQKAEHKKIDISVMCRPSILVRHDVKWTAEAIENIIDNAVKYTPEGGKIVISAAAGEMYTEIKIKDTGKGIEAAHINDIFKRFYREKEVSKTEGLGLGLYLARNIVTLQGGYISVHSAPGKGSCFSICLPNRAHG